jgi:hypothetical protein
MNSYYFFLLIIPFVLLMNVNVSGTKIMWIFLAFAIPLSIVGLLQHLLNQPILPLASADGEFSINSWQFGDRVRAFSLFDSGLDFGHYLSICASLVVAAIAVKRKKMIAMNSIMLILFTMAVYTTLTRNIYIEYLFSIICVLIVYLFINKKYLAVLPIVLYLFGLLINNIAPLMAKIYHQHSIFNLETYITRQNEWITVKNVWLSQGYIKALFGTGFIQSDKYELTRNLLIDNSVLAVGLHTGIVGLIFYILIMWFCWMYCVKVTVSKQNVFNIALTGFFSTWALTGIFNINFSTYAVVFILFLLGNSKRMKFINKNQYILWKNE